MTSVPHPVRRVLGEKDERAQISNISILETHHWRPRDYLAAALLFLATAAFVTWQNARVAVLWDLGYLLDTSWRIAAGQMPYRDFPLAHAPLTFLIQAGIMRLCGRHFLLVIAYAATAGGLATVLTWRILLRIVRGSRVFGRATWLIAFVMTAPLAFVGIYSIYPHPIYDCDCTLAILTSILLLSWAQWPMQAGAKALTDLTAVAARLKSCPVTKHLSNQVLSQPVKSYPVTTHVAALAAGGAVVVPLFFKQNIGLPFLLVVAAGMFVLLALDLLRTRSLRAALQSQPARVLAGIVSVLLAGLGAIAGTAGLGNYLHWTVQFAAQRRLPGLASILAVYNQPSFAWMAPSLASGLILCHIRFIARLGARIAAFSLIALPFAGSLIFLLVHDNSEDRADNLLALFPLLLIAALVLALFELRRGITLGRMIPFVIIAAIHGTLLSQQLWGSTYALWPLLMVLVAFVLGTFPLHARPVAIGFAGVISATFLICGSLYSVSLDRLQYIQIPDAPVARSSLSALRGMATPGPFLSNFDELVDFTAHQIPPADALVLLPGEDPFFYATGRAPHFPVTLFDPATDPYSASELMDEARRRNVGWLIVKRALQVDDNPMPEREATMDMVRSEFVLYSRLGGYDVYRRR